MSMSRTVAHAMIPVAAVFTMLLAVLPGVRMRSTVLFLYSL